ncbi:plakophilin-1 isoform X3 [Chanodichthys erythropterus]|uniref:plakophilin-1 isoform X3 n=1 Tax=Chanodichthys erythropterus TaxID=933992 RepID=UPI00351F0C30
MTAEPIRSALGTVSKEDTSLVLPSDGKQRTGQQRVLEQVKSIKRGKSKMVKSDSIPSPTTPASATEFSEPKFQFSPTKLNDTLFKFSGSSMMGTQSRVTGRSLSVRNTVRRQTQNSQSDSQMNWKVQSQSNGMKASASKLENSTLISASQSQFKTLSSQSQSVKKFTRSKSETSAANGAMGAMPDITLKEAVEFLTHSDMSYQLCGASFIQHQTFIEDTAKQEVWRLGGVPALVQLLKSENIQLQQTAAAALRNMVFKENEIKLEVESCEGLEAILTLLRNTNVTETQKQLTGLLWNLSSADALKPELIRNALPLLTETIVVPFNFWTDSNINKHIDAEVFHNTTGCLRNLSCASDNERTSMRNCTQLIDSLMTYVQTQVERGEPDDKTVENCVCILHNLSYQLEKEAPEHFTEFSIPDGSSHENMNKNSLFSPRSSKAQKEFRFPAMEEGQPEGVKCLFHRKSLQLYLSLLGSSHKEATLEACCGALQNLTASKSPVSTVMTQSIIQKLQGLSVISPLLYSANPGLQKTAMSLVGNMSRVSSLRSTMGSPALHGYIYLQVNYIEKSHPIDIVILLSPTPRLP